LLQGTNGSIFLTAGINYFELDVRDALCNTPYIEFKVQNFHREVSELVLFLEEQQA
jgi:hypothetical protein